MSTLVLFQGAHIQTQTLGLNRRVILRITDEESNEIREQQQKDQGLIEIMDYIQNDTLPSNDTKARKILLRIKSECH